MIGPKSILRFMTDERETPLTYDDWSQLSAEERVATFKRLAPGEDDDFFLSLNAREQAKRQTGCSGTR